LEQSSVGLAVRSSSLVEDSTEASFAGVFDSMLGVNSLQAVEEALRRCWCAGWSPSAMRYARRHDLKLAPDHMAVIVQELVEAQSAGVLFTADALTGNPWVFSLEACHGLAAELVAGDAAADHWTLAWDTGKVEARQVVTKDRQLVADQNGLMRVSVSHELSRAPALTDSQIGLLHSIGLEVDQAFKCRMDIEWAVGGDNKVYLVQARPVTALPPFFPLALDGLTLDGQDAAESRSLSEPWFLYAYQKGYVGPLFADLWDSKAWVRYKPADMTLGHLEFRERDFNGYRYATDQVWKEPKLEPGRPEIWTAFEEWLEVNDDQMQQQWKTTLAQMQQRTRRATQGQHGTHSAAELAPILLDQYRCMRDLEPMNLGPSQSMG
jgi:hypothetical protein